MQPGNIEVTGVPLEALVRAAYRPSRPQGLGFFHYEEGDLTDAEVAEIVGRGHDRIAVSMDYVKGRACKFTVYREGDRLFIRNQWYDHSTDQLKSLLSSVGLSPDLVEKAREEERAYDDLCVEKALSVLRDNEGVLKISPDDRLDRDVESGLYQAKHRKLVTEDYEFGSGSTWSLAADVLKVDGRA